MRRYLLSTFSFGYYTGCIIVVVLGLILDKYDFSWWLTLVLLAGSAIFFTLMQQLEKKVNGTQFTVKEVLRILNYMRDNGYISLEKNKIESEE